MLEAGRGNGVSRDVYASFWVEILDSYFIGENERVPFVRHDLFVTEWEAIGKILFKGYIDVHYFPMLLSKSFMSYVLFGENEDDHLLSSFLNYIAEDHRKLVNEAISTDDESFFQSDDFFEFLDEFKCRTLITKSNVRSTIIELARQELIQKPHLMAACWKTHIAAIVSFSPFKDWTSLNAFYADMVPTTKKVIALIDAVTNDDSEKDCLTFLKRYIRGLDSNMLKKLLRFLTGTDSITVEKISIIFIKQSSFERRPIAHTCGPSLELSSTYSSFCELREEFSNILKENTWEMNIV